MKTPPMGTTIRDVERLLAVAGIPKGASWLAQAGFQVTQWMRDTRGQIHVSWGGRGRAAGIERCRAALVAAGLTVSDLKGHLVVAPT